MFELLGIIERMGKAPVYALAAVAAFTSALMLVIIERRVTVLLLMVHYLLMGLLILPDMYRPVVLVRMTTGVATCGLLYLTARHIQSDLAGLPAPGHSQSLIATLRATSTGGMGLGFRLLLVLFAALLVYGTWQAYPLTLITRGYGATLYSAMAIGFLMLLINLDPLRKGVGLLLLLSGFEGIYLYLEQSLIVIELLGIVSIMLALAIAYLAEVWLVTLAESEAPE